MWLRRSLDIYQLIAVKVIPKCNNYFKILSENMILPYHHSCRHLSACSRVLQSKPSYVYDPNSGSFVPKGHSQGYDPGPNEERNRQDNEKKGKFIPKLKRFMGRVFLFASGIIFGTLSVISFVEIKDEDEDEQVRMFAFYDVATTKTELANISKSYDDEIDKKGLALRHAFDMIRFQDVIIERLGKPVLLTGYRAAAKVGRMIDNFHNLTQFDLETLPSDTSNKDVWCAECVIEGPKGLASLTLEFEQPLDTNEWVLVKVTANMLEQSHSHLLELKGSIPDGVNFK